MDRRTRRRTAILAMVAAVSLLALESPADASGGVRTAPGGSLRASDTPQRDPLQVVIDRLQPSVVPTTGTLRVSGTIRNRSDEQWRDLTVYLVTSSQPITTRAGLDAAVASDPRLEVGSRIVEPGTFVTVPDLQPGQRTRFRLKVRRADLGISGAPGVYWLGVHVLGTTDSGRLAGADGRARTFLPLVPPRSGRTQLALGLQVRDQVVRGPDGRLELPEQWQRSVARGGRLGRLVRLGASAPPAWPLTWIVDPAVVDAVGSVAEGNPPVRLGETASRGGSGRAQDWLDRFTAATGNAAVLALPYADLDVSAAAAQGRSDLVSTAWTAGLQQLGSRSVTATPVLVPRDGLVSPEAYSLLPAQTPVVLTPGAAGDGTSGELLNRPDGGVVLLSPPGDTLTGPGPTSYRSALSLRQELLAQAALHALSGQRSRPLVQLLPAGWDPGGKWRAARFFAGLSVPWLTGTSLAGVLAAPTVSRTLGPAQLTYPSSAQQAELPAALLRATEGVIASGVPLEELLGRKTAVADQLTRLGLTGSSVSNRDRPGFAIARMRGARQMVHDWLRRVSVRGPSFVTMSGETGTFQVALINGLDQPVTVGLRASVTGTGLEVSTPRPVELGPRARVPVRVQARAAGIGVHRVRLQPVSAQGTPVGQPTRISVRSSRVGFVVWLIMGVGGAALVLAIVVRVGRRLRLRRRTHGPLLERAR